MEFYNISYHIYANETQIYVCISPYDHISISKTMGQDCFHFSVEKTKLFDFGSKRAWLQIKTQLKPVVLKSTQYRI